METERAAAQCADCLYNLRYGWSEQAGHNWWDDFSIVREERVGRPAFICRSQAKHTLRFSVHYGKRSIACSFGEAKEAMEAPSAERQARLALCKTKWEGLKRCALILLRRSRHH